METDNRLIAEFMGGLFNIHSQKYGIENAEFTEIGRLKNVVRAVNHYSVNDLKYHNDWNWLMEVVEKIESLSFDVFINTCVCRITDVGQEILEDIETFDYENKKQAVYNACLEFIKWYNEQKL